MVTILLGLGREDEAFKDRGNFPTTRSIVPPPIFLLQVGRRAVTSVDRGKSPTDPNKREAIRDHLFHRPRFLWSAPRTSRTN